MMGGNSFFIVSINISHDNFCHITQTQREGFLLYHKNFHKKIMSAPKSTLTKSLRSEGKPIVKASKTTTKSDKSLKSELKEDEKDEKFMIIVNKGLLIHSQLEKTRRDDIEAYKRLQNDITFFDKIPLSAELVKSLLYHSEMVSNACEGYDGSDEVIMFELPNEIDIENFQHILTFIKIDAKHYAKKGSHIKVSTIEHLELCNVVGSLELANWLNNVFIDDMDMCESYIKANNTTDPTFVMTTAMLFGVANRLQMKELCRALIAPFLLQYVANRSINNIASLFGFAGIENTFVLNPESAKRLVKFYPGIKTIYEDHAEFQSLLVDRPISTGLTRIVAVDVASENNNSDSGNDSNIFDGEDEDKDNMEEEENEDNYE